MHGENLQTKHIFCFFASGMPTCNGSSQCLLAVQVTCCFKKAMFRAVKFQPQMLCESETCQGTDLDCSCHQKNQHSLLTTTMESWKGVPTDTPLKPSSSSNILNKLKATTWLCKSATQQCAMAGSMFHTVTCFCSMGNKGKWQSTNLLASHAILRSCDSAWHKTFASFGLELQW